MLQAVKAKINNLLTPILDRSNSDRTTVSAERRTNRKRKNQLDTDYLPNPPKKKQHQSDGSLSLSPLFRKWHCRISDIYNYVVQGNVNMSERGAAHKKNTKPSTGYSSLYEGTRDSQRKLAVRRRDSSRRMAFAQISNSSILDFTNADDDDDDNLNQELRITKVKVDLIKPTKPIPYRSKTIQSDQNSLDQKDKYLDEIIRLDERKRYQELLAHFTAVTLPEYSVSVSPSRSPECAKSAASLNILETFHQPISNSVNTLSFHTSKQTKPILIDLTKKDNNQSHFGSSRKTKTHATILESLSQTAADTSLQTSVAEINHKSQTPVIDLATVQKREHQVAVDNILLSSNWIKKWKEALDPLQLERERQIKEEEYKKEQIKSKRKAEFERIQKELEKSKVKEFPELTQDMLEKVKKALAPGRSNDVFVQGFNAEITRADLTTLREATWLNDEVVNFYFNLLKERSEKSEGLPRVHVFNTFFYPKIVKTGHAGVKRWTRKVDIFSYDLILIPIHLGMHWCLAVIDFQSKAILYYDSLKANNLQCVSLLKEYLQDESRDKKKTGFDFTGWTELMPKDIPEQMNGCDCGVFMCKYAECKSRNAAFTFAQKDMPYFRKRMIYEIISKELM